MKAPRILFIILPALVLCLAAGVVRPSPTHTARAEAGTPQAGDDSQRAQALLELSLSQNFEDHALALETAHQALSLFQTAGDNEGVARAYNIIARCHLAQNDLTEASQNFEAALQIWRDLNNPQEQTRVLISLGFVEARKGEWQNSISLLTQAEELNAGGDNLTQMGRIASGLGYVFNETGLPEKGLAQYQRALDYFQRTANARDVALTTLEIGNSQYLLGNYPEALANFQQALPAFPPDGLDAAECHHYLGKVYSSMGEYGAALQHLQSTLPVYTRTGNLREAADVLALIGQIHEQQGRLEPARRNYRRALETFTRVTDRINQAAVSYALGRLEMRAGNYAVAEEYLRQSVEGTENIRRVPASNDLTAAFSATVYERYERYVECIMRRHESQPTRGLDVRAFEMIELARGRSLTELLRATQTNLVKGFDPKLAQRERSLRQALRVREDSKVALLGGKYKTKELTELNEELARLEAEYKQVEEEILALYPTYGQITRPTAWGLRSIQEQIVEDDQTVLLEFLLGADKSYVWAVTRDGIRSYDLPPGARIDEVAQKVYRYISTSPGADSPAEGEAAIRELSRMALLPVVAELKNKSRVIVVADGVLNYIPFQVLTVSQSDDAPVVANYEVVNAPSATILGELRQEAARRHPPTKLLAAFGDPVFASNYAQRRDAEGGAELAALEVPDDGRRQLVSRSIELKEDSFNPSAIRPLFYATREMSNLHDVTAGSETFVATGFAATRERLLSTDLSQYAILHFATHGLLDPKRPENSGLLLSTVEPDGRALNGFVGMQSVYELRAPVDLVVLSACRTALGKDVRGEGLLGLTRGFMYAGASSVVSSLWKVDDEATTELMKEFYANMLRKGATPATALRAAQNSIRQRPEWRSPYYWAAFTLQGEYRQVIKPAPAAGAKGSYLLTGACLFLLALSAGGTWWYRRTRARAASAGA